MATQRNAPCPCGSGKKFKHCHLGKEAELAPAEDGEDIVEARGKPWWLLSIPLVLGVAMGFWKGTEMGFYVGVAALLAVGGLVVFKDPPPPRNQGNASGIGFGR